MEMKSQCTLYQTIDRLTAEIHRIQKVQRFVARADRAVKAGRDEVLRRMGFSAEHIEDLKQTASRSKKSAFPSYLRSNNAATIGYLRREIAALQRYLCTCSTGSKKIHGPSAAPPISYDV